MSQKPALESDLREGKGSEGFPFSYFTLLLSVMIFVAGILWLAYSYLPHEFYLPIGFSVLLVAAVVVYVTIYRKIRL
ncbi:MAG: hypothetical protein QXX17_07240 [Conexivisphaerales archaeon]